MLPRRFGLVVWLLCLGCPGAPAGPDQALESAGELWEKGQAAMRAGAPARAVGFYERSLQVDPGFSRSHLSLAAAFLECSDDRAACVELGRYIEAHPENLLVRSQYAELLARLKRPREARAELDRLIAHAQERGDDDLGEMIHWHSRILDLAEEQEDDYGAHLHRGIGLYLLARQRAGLENPDGVLPVEALLCRSVSELTVAQLLQPGEARPSWYLHLAWTRLGQAGPAQRCLAQATTAAPFGGLSPAEQRSLTLAGRAREALHPGR